MDYLKLAEEFMQHSIHFRKAFKKDKITDAMRGELFVLMLLASQKGILQPGEISEEMNSSTARVATILNRLEEKGFITRSIDPDDRRRVLVKLTSEGHELTCQKRRQTLSNIADILEKLGEKDAREFVRILGRIGKSI